MTYQLHLQLDDSLEGNLRAFAAANRLTLSAAVRFLLIQALKENEDARLSR
jgi:hypothetical protein